MVKSKGPFSLERYLKGDSSPGMKDFGEGKRIFFIPGILIEREEGRWKGTQVNYPYPK